MPNSEPPGGKLDKFVLTGLGIILALLYGQVWTIQNQVSIIEVRQAELRGQVIALVASIQSLVDRGSQTAQRTETVVEGLVEHLARIDQFMSLGDRFTTQDGEKLLQRIEELEQQHRGMKGQKNRP